MGQGRRHRAHPPRAAGRRSQVGSSGTIDPLDRPRADGPPPRKILVYDGDCSLCIGVSTRLLRWTRRGEETRRSAQAFEGEDAERIAASDVHNEMAVMDPATKEIRNGVDGLLWWLEGSRLAWLARLLGWGPLRWSVGVGYPVIAYNRRILAPPPPRAIACACDPDPRPGTTIALGAFALAVTVGAFLGLGAVAAHVGPAGWRGRPWDVVQDGDPWMKIAGVWLVPTLVLIVLLRPVGSRLIHAAAFLWSMALGSILLVLGAVTLAVLGPSVARWGLLVGIGQVVVSIATYRRRLRMLRASSGWLAVLLLSVIAFLSIPPLRDLLHESARPTRDFSKVRR